jgi:hypothetical protein
MTTPLLYDIPEDAELVHNLPPDRDRDFGDEAKIAVRGLLRRLTIIDDPIPPAQMPAGVVVRGGEGSGHFEHEGRPGKVGGSQPGKEGKGKKLAEPEPRAPTEVPPPVEEGEIEGSVVKKLSGEDVGFDSEEQFQQVSAIADARVAAAEEIEPDLTMLMGQMATTNDGKLERLEHRLKDAESLTRKIRMDMLEKGLTAEEAEASINDVNRYTMSFPWEGFVERVLAVQEGLAKQGWTMYDHKWKNYFQSGDAYDGYNCVMVNESTGARFEVQFHTPQSIAVQSQSHELFSQFRVLGADQQNERRNLWSRMVSLWEESEDYQRPDNWWVLPGVMK